MQHISLRAIQTWIPSAVGRGRRKSGVLMLFLLCGAFLISWAQDTGQDRGPKLFFNALASPSSDGVERFSGGFDQAPLDSLIEFVADVTGKRFFVDPPVSGSVTLSVESQTAQQCFETLLAILHQQGFDVAQEGSDVRIFAPTSISPAAPSNAPSRVIAIAARAASFELGPHPEEPRSVAPTIALRAVQDHGVQSGYRVYPLGEGDEFKRLGLNAGDLVTSINGRSLADREQGERIFQDAMAANEVTVRLERAGERLYLRLNKRSISAWLAPASDAARSASSLRMSSSRFIPGDAGAFMIRQPVFANSKLLGYRLYPRNGLSEFKKHGLQPGDLVTSINGRALDEPIRSAEIFDAELESGSAILQIQREGHTLQVTL